MFRAPGTLATDRLVLRRPVAADAESMLAYAGDPDATRYMGWKTHAGIEDTRRFLEVAKREWKDIGVGAYLLTLDGAVIGSTGLHVLGAHRALTGYILRREAWGAGFATEACRAMVDLGRRLGLARIEAQCHVDHAPSMRVLEKVGMSFEGVLRRYCMFPNLSGEPQHVRSYAWTQADG